MYNKYVLLIIVKNDFFSFFKKCLILFVLVCLGCRSNIPQTGGFKQQTFTSYGSGGWKAKIGMPALWGSGESSLPGLRMLPSSCVLTWQREEALVSFLIRALIPS